jgi:hypothetical protein
VVVALVALVLPTGLDASSAGDTPTGGGYWFVASDGGVFAFGDAAFHGSAGNLPLRSPVVGMAATPSGGGYWLVAADGGIFSYGDAAFHGSTGATPLNRPIVGMAATPTGGGYWFVVSDGGVFNYGAAAFHGSAGNVPLRSPVVGMAATPSGGGVVAADGGIFSYGDAVFHGSTGATPLNRPIVGMATAPAFGAGADGVAQLRVAAEGPRTGYSRTLFRHWIDEDGDGCDTRREVLIAEAVTAPAVGAGCTLTGGSWLSRYDGATTTDPSSFDIDHVVPLAEAWDSGAAGWDAARRERFANDLGYEHALIAVSASSNRSKGDQDPAEWKPPRIEFLCDYAQMWSSVKIRWELTADAAEMAALRTMLAGCDGGAGTPTARPQPLLPGGVSFGPHSETRQAPDDATNANTVMARESRWTCAAARAPTRAPTLHGGIGHLCHNAGGSAFLREGQGALIASKSC